MGKDGIEPSRLPDRAREGSAGANAQLVIGGLTEDPADAPGPFGVYLRATTHTMQRSTSVPAAVPSSMLRTGCLPRQPVSISNYREVERLYHELQDTFERSSQAKALKQSDRLKSALLDAVTHDLRTPLTSIKASATTLLDDQRSLKSGAREARLDEEGRQEMLEIIDEEADRLDRFIGDLMELARIEAGDMQLRREWGSSFGNHYHRDETRGDAAKGSSP